MHDPSKPPEGDISKCPFFAALSGAMSAFAQGAGGNPTTPTGPNTGRPTDAPATPIPAERVADPLTANTQAG
jgi:hypothetical protein